VFDHVTIRVSDRAASERFYTTVLRTLGVEQQYSDDVFVEWDGSFSLVPGTPTEHVHLAFAAGGDAAVDAFHRAASEAGHRDNGGPGERAVYHPGYYAAFVLDPDGNNVEAVNHNR
jgi:catechol 2,3-dioxygenase-like lactoylglutathione lyase family enzyme